MTLRKRVFASSRDGHIATVAPTPPIVGRHDRVACYDCGKSTTPTWLRQVFRSERKERVCVSCFGENGRVAWCYGLRLRRRACASIASRATVADRESSAASTVSASSAASALFGSVTFTRAASSSGGFGFGPRGTFFLTRPTSAELACARDSP